MGYSSVSRLTKWRRKKMLRNSWIIWLEERPKEGIFGIPGVEMEPMDRRKRYGARKPPWQSSLEVM